MKKYLLSIAVLMAATVSFTSCDDDDNDGDGDGDKQQLVQNGVYVINEGSYYSGINGSLDFLGYDKLSNSYGMYRNVFDQVNGRSLGGTPNNAVIYADSLLFIAVTDENRVEIVNTHTNKAYTAISVAQPREMAYGEGSDYLYVTSYTGKVTKINMKTCAKVGESQKLGANLEGVAVSGNNVYVCNAYNSDYTYNKDLVVVNAETLAATDTITVLDNPVQVLTTGSDIYVLSMGNYYDVQASVQRIHNGESEVIANATMMACNTKRGLIYMVNAPYGGDKEYKVYNIATKTTSTFLNNPDIFSPYSIAVDNVSGDVYISSQSKDEDTGYASYTTDGKLFRYSSEGILLGSYDCGVSPGTIVCNSYWKKMK